jgi:hypothetical protein
MQEAGAPADDVELEALDLDAAEAIQSLAGGLRRRRRGSGSSMDTSPIRSHRAVPPAGAPQPLSPHPVDLQPPRKPRSQWYCGRDPSDSSYDDAQLGAGDYEETAAMGAHEPERFSGLAPRSSGRAAARRRAPLLLGNDSGRSAKRAREGEQLPQLGASAAFASDVAPLQPRQSMGPPTPAVSTTVGEHLTGLAPHSSGRNAVDKRALPHLGNDGSYTAKRARMEEPLVQLGSGVACASGMAPLQPRQSMGPPTPADSATIGEAPEAAAPSLKPQRSLGDLILPAPALPRQACPLPADIEQRHSNSLPAPGRAPGCNGSVPPSSPEAGQPLQLDGHLPPEWLPATDSAAELATRSSTTLAHQAAREDPATLAIEAAVEAADAKAKGGSAAVCGALPPVLVLQPQHLVPVDGGLLALPLDICAHVASGGIQARFHAVPFICTCINCLCSRNDAASGHAAPACFCMLSSFKCREV